LADQNDMQERLTARLCGPQAFNKAITFQVLTAVREAPNLPRVFPESGCWTKTMRVGGSNAQARIRRV
jgi:hypothetical protein